MRSILFRLSTLTPLSTPPRSRYDMTPEIRNSIKAGAYTALFTFIAMFGLSLIGWLQDIAEWASSSGTDEFPSFTTLGYASISAITAAVIGLFNTVVRLAQAALGKGTIPSYDK